MSKAKRWPPSDSTETGVLTSNFYEDEDNSESRGTDHYTAGEADRHELARQGGAPVVGESVNLTTLPPYFLTFILL